MAKSIPLNNAVAGKQSPSPQVKSRSHAKISWRDYYEMTHCFNLRVTGDWYVIGISRGD